MAGAHRCPHCGATDRLRPHIVWFGEMPIGLERLDAALAQADLFVAIGPSGSVYPAAGFVRQARRAGARTIEINVAASENAHDFDERRLGPAGEVVPAWVDEVLGSGRAVPKLGVEHP